MRDDAYDIDALAQLGDQMTSGGLQLDEAAQVELTADTVEWDAAELARFDQAAADLAAEFTPSRVAKAREIAVAHGCTLERIRLAGRIRAGFRIVDASGKTVAGRQHELSPSAVAEHFGVAL